MTIYLGGTGHGHAAVCEKETGLRPETCSPEAALRAPAVADFHLLIRAVLEAGGDAQDFARRLLAENPGAAVCCDEIGGGIVPLDPFERRWREETGRALCILAEGAERVTRVYCGIPQVIK